MSAIPTTFIDRTSRLPEDAARPFPSSRKVYFQGSRAHRKVGMREVKLSDTPASIGAEKQRAGQGLRHLRPLHGAQRAHRTAGRPASHEGGVDRGARRLSRPRRAEFGTRATAIHCHVFCSFLALIIQKELADPCPAAGFGIEWDDLIRDLNHLQQATVEQHGKRVTIRTHVQRQVDKVFRAASVALPRTACQHHP